jgi:hypothetical protein
VLGAIQLFTFILVVFAFVLGRLIGIDTGRHRERTSIEADNPRCFCPDCGADLGYFYSNRIRMERR